MRVQIGLPWGQRGSGSSRARAMSSSAAAFEASPSLIAARQAASAKAAALRVSGSPGQFAHRLRRVAGELRGGLPSRPRSRSPSPGRSLQRPCPPTAAAIRSSSASSSHSILLRYEQALRLGRARHQAVEKHALVGRVLVEKPQGSRALEYEEGPQGRTEIAKVPPRGRRREGGRIPPLCARSRNTS